MPSADCSTTRVEVVAEFDFTVNDKLPGVPVKFTILRSPVVSNFAPLLPEQAKLVRYDLILGESVQPVGVVSHVVLETGNVVCPEESAQLRTKTKSIIFFITVVL